MLPDEGEHALVGDEEEEEPDGGLGVGVVPAGELPHASADVLQEGGAEARALDVGVAVEVAQVVVDRELDVHVEHAALGQEEGEVGHGAGGDGLLLPVVDALGEADEPQDVLGHALAPLAPSPRAGERLPQSTGDVRQPSLDASGLVEAGREPPAWRLVGLEAGDEVAELPNSPEICRTWSVIDSLRRENSCWLVSARATTSATPAPTSNAVRTAPVTAISIMGPSMRWGGQSPGA